MRALEKNVFRVLLLAVVFPLVAGGAHAGVGDRVGEAVYGCKSSSPIEKAQYFSFDDEDYCWYDDGWHGPGWYWCGYESYNGYGWGGPYGWNGAGMVPTALAFGIPALRAAALARAALRRPRVCRAPKLRPAVILEPPALRAAPV